MKVFVALAPTVTLDPDPSKFIGGRVIQRIADGLAGQGLILCVAIFAFGAVMWALSGRGNNVALGADGKTRVIIAAFAALLIAASPAIINFCIELGGQI